MDYAGLEISAKQFYSYNENSVICEDVYMFFMIEDIGSCSQYKIDLVAVLM